MPETTAVEILESDKWLLITLVKGGDVYSCVTVVDGDFRIIPTEHFDLENSRLELKLVPDRESPGRLVAKGLMSLNRVKVSGQHLGSQQVGRTRLIWALTNVGRGLGVELLAQARANAR